MQFGSVRLQVGRCWKETFLNCFGALGSDGVFGLRPTFCPGRCEVLRFELMVERGLCDVLMPWNYTP